jgi:hypothetical protein
MERDKNSPLCIRGRGVAEQIFRRPQVRSRITPNHSLGAGIPPYKIDRKPISTGLLALLANIPNSYNSPNSTPVRTGFPGKNRSKGPATTATRTRLL